MNKLQKAAQWLRNNSWNTVTPRKLMERFDLSADEVRNLCRENSDISVQMVVARPTRTPHCEPPTFVRLKDHMGDLTPNDVQQVWRNLITLLVQQAFVAFARMHEKTGENHIWEEGPVELQPLEASEWPDLWWQADSQLIGGKRYKIKIESEWTIEDETNRERTNATD